VIEASMAAQTKGTPRETGKQRSLRIPLDYFKHPDLLERGKLWVTAAAFALALGWWASGLEWDSQRGGVRQSDRGRQRASAGPVALVHAPWESKCETCHVPFAPISAAGWLSPSPSQLATNNERCTSCHAGPIHHATEDKTPACAQCHREHQGREASLVRLPDRDCVGCHADLASHTRPGAPRPAFGDVRDFDHDHPEFQAVRQGQAAKDPGKLKFNHALHMAPGMVLGKGGKPFVLGQIDDPAQRSRYRRSGQSDRDAATLDCGSCHRTESSDFGLARMAELPAGMLPARGSRAYMLPITYENQCRACHPLDIEPRSAEARGAHQVTVRHRLQPKELHAALEEAYAARFLMSPPQSAEASDKPIRRLPARDLREQERDREALVRSVFRAEQILYLGSQTCSECHRFDTPDGRVLPEQIQPNAVPAFRVEDPAIPQIWFANALFDHGAHRAVSCRECHAGAYPDGQSASGAKVRGPSYASEDVLIPGIATCRQCHAPARRSGGLSTGGARFDCAECHRYHNGDHPLAGLGASMRSAREELDIQRFLSGSRPSPRGGTH
jgi:predicted CXXCH cytochrome family protein